MTATFVCSTLCLTFRCASPSTDAVDSARVPEFGATVFPPDSRKRLEDGTSQFLGAQGIHFGHDAVAGSGQRPTAGTIWIPEFHLHEPIRGGGLEYEDFD